jgi:hypothetical protein
VEEGQHVTSSGAGEPAARQSGGADGDPFSDARSEFVKAFGAAATGPDGHPKMKARLIAAAAVVVVAAGGAVAAGAIADAASASGASPADLKVIAATASASGTPHPARSNGTVRVGTAQPVTGGSGGSGGSGTDVGTDRGTAAHGSATSTQTTSATHRTATENVTRTTTTSSTANRSAKLARTASATPTPTTFDGPSTLVVHATSVLHLGQSWTASRVRITLRSSGNLVITNPAGRVLMSAGTAGSGYQAVFQGDGNLAVYDKAGKSVWSTRTENHNNAILVLQGDGNVTIDLNNVCYWASGS